MEYGRILNKKKLGVRKNGEVLRWYTETVNQGKRAMGLRERDGFVGLRERKMGREIRWVWAAMGDGEENFAGK